MIRLNGIRNAQTAMELAGLNWSAEQTGLMGNNGIDVKSHKLLFRNDNSYPLGVVGNKYQPIQNTEAFAFFDTVCEQFHATYEYAAEIRGGRKIVLQAKLGKQFEVRPGDPIDEYVTLINSHDGSCSLRCFYTPIRLFCMNQMHVAMERAYSTIILRHTPNIESRIQEAFRVFQFSEDYFSKFQEKARFLAQKVCDTFMVNRFLDDVLGNTETTRNKNQRESVVRLFEQGKGNGRGSAWDLVNGLVEWVDHFRMDNESKRLESSMFGQGAILKNRAWETALSL